MANTTNYNWETPDDTDLVKDGAAAIRTLGNSIDTTTKNLNPETTTGDIAYRSATANTNTRLAIGSTGQVLTVAAGVPSWATPTVGDITEVQAGTGISVASGTGPIPVITNTVATAFDAAGDLVYGTGADTFAKLSLGTAGQVLKVNSGATAPEWGTVASTTFPAFSATPNSTLTPSASTDTKVLFQTETFDSDGTFASSTFTPNKAGYYQINCNLLCNNNGRVIVYLFKNGSVYTRLVDHNSTVNIVAAGSCLVSMNGTTDYLELYIYMTGATRSVDSGATVTSFNGVGIRSN